MDTVDPQQKTDFQLIENIPFTTAKVMANDQNDTTVDEGKAIITEPEV